jgi:hypothetical protein
VRIRYLPIAVDELEKNALWLNEHAGGRGSEFLDVFGTAIARISANPMHYPRFEAAMELAPHLNIRRYVLKPFAHMVLFEVRTDLVLIVAVMHPSQRPDFWLPRVE